MSNTISVDILKKAMPKAVRNNLTQEMVDDINGMIQSNEVAENFRDTLLGHTSIMKEGKFKMESYLNAAKYVSFKLMCSTNEEAFMKTFPERYQEMLDQGLEDRKISGYVHAYSKTILVNKILEQTMIPIHVFNGELYQKAINAQAFLMINASSDKVKSDAANSLLQHLKPPETSKIELDVNVKEDKVIGELKNTIAELSAVQKKQIESGVSTVKEVAHSKLLILDAEVID